MATEKIAAACALIILVDEQVDRGSIGLREEDIRPLETFREYLRLSVQDSKRYFSSAEKDDLPCPACGSTDVEPSFEKHHFGYARCKHCGTLYQTPRPTPDCFEAFYRDSVSSQYWAEEFFPRVAESRRERIFAPRVARLQELCAEHAFQPGTVMDIGAGYGIFLEEWLRQMPDSHLIAVEPSAHLADVCREKGFEVVQEMAEQVKGYDKVADLAICFEVLEHVHEPLAFVRTLRGFVAPGGYLLVSTLCIDGFDLQILWERSNSISPPHHINFFSINGLERLFTQAGFTDIEVITPGRLDVDIVRNALADYPDLLDGQRFLTRLIEDQELGDKFQAFLQENRLSSHAWILGRRA